jgi:hypothetical protein
MSEPAEVSSQGISKEQAKKILDADLANLVKKVASGKTLSSAERALVSALSDVNVSESVTTSAFVKKQSELADALKLKSRKTISRWLKEIGGTNAAIEKGLIKDDGRYDVVAWKAFAKTKGHTFEDDEHAEHPHGNATKAKAEQLLIQNDRLRLKLGREKEELIPKALAQQVFSKLLFNAKTRSYSAVIRLVTISRMAQSTTEATEKVKLEIDEIWKSLTDSKWLKQ